MRKFQKKIKDFEDRYHVIAALLIGTALILFWRGIWHLADLYLFPKSPATSAVASIVLAIVILYFRDFDLKELFTH